KPMMLLAIGAALIFLPTITDTASATLFGKSGGTSSGPSGAIIGS
ncbi:MAG: type IV secretion protein IcmD, partial [Gammaproteobacteria bacterium]|nr:type IV secretion protein IcmD [Gammaproteobacteria bacterium]